MLVIDQFTICKVSRVYCALYSSNRKELVTRLLFTMGTKRIVSF